jgi:enoyl-CoA hydratase
LIRVEREEAVAIVTIDRQEALNALDVATLTELRDRLRQLADDASARVVIVTGAGEKAFVAGADIKYMSGLDVDQAKEWGALGHEAGRLLETMPKPTIAAINGFALGGGCELAAACDIRYAASSAKLGQPEVNLGIIPGWGGTQRIARLCGLGVAKELIFTGRTVDAKEALRIGLVSGVHDPVLDKAREVGALLASKSPIALRLMKELANRALGGDHAQNLEAEGETFGELFSSEDAKEGLAAFAEKREPKFSGRCAASRRKNGSPGAMARRKDSPRASGCGDVQTHNRRHPQGCHRLRGATG